LKDLCIEISDLSALNIPTIIYKEIIQIIKKHCAVEAQAEVSAWYIVRVNNKVQVRFATHGKSVLILTSLIRSCQAGTTRSVILA
jgi:predicted DNA-binding protein (UPF0278 family)